MTRTFIRFAGLMLAALLATGCASLNVKQPTASFRSASVENVGPDGATVNFDVNVQNPNAVAIPLHTAKYKLGLAGVNVLDDQAKPSTSIPANGSLPVTLPVRLSFQTLLKAEQSLVKTGGNVPYDFDGSLEFAPPDKSPLAALGAGSVKVPLRFSGTLAFRDAFERAMRDPETWRNPDARHLLESVLGKGILGNLLGR